MTMLLLIALQWYASQELQNARRKLSVGADSSASVLVSGFSKAHALALSRDGNTLWVADSDDSEIYHVSTQTGSKSELTLVSTTLSNPSGLVLQADQ